MRIFCRTCLSEIETGAQFFSLDSREPDFCELIRTKLEACVPDLDLEIVKDPVLCTECADSVGAAYEFKKKCLSTEEKIYDFIIQTDSEGKSIDLHVVVNWLPIFDVDIEPTFVSKNEASSSKQLTDTDASTSSSLQILSVVTEDECPEIISVIESDPEDTSNPEALEESIENADLQVFNGVVKRECPEVIDLDSVEHSYTAETLQQLIGNTNTTVTCSIETLNKIIGNTNTLAGYNVHVFNEDSVSEDILTADAVPPDLTRKIRNSLDVSHRSFSNILDGTVNGFNQKTSKDIFEKSTVYEVVNDPNSEGNSNLAAGTQETSENCEDSPPCLPREVPCIYTRQSFVDIPENREDSEPPVLEREVPCSVRNYRRVDGRVLESFNNPRCSSRKIPHSLQRGKNEIYRNSRKFNEISARSSGENLSIANTATTSGSSIVEKLTNELKNKSQSNIVTYPLKNKETIATTLQKIQVSVQKNTARLSNITRTSKNGDLVRGETERTATPAVADLEKTFEPQSEATWSTKGNFVDLEQTIPSYTVKPLLYKNKSQNDAAPLKLVSITKLGDSPAGCSKNINVNGVVSKETKVPTNEPAVVGNVSTFGNYSKNTISASSDPHKYDDCDTISITANVTVDRSKLPYNIDARQTASAVANVNGKTIKVLSNVSLCSSNKPLNVGDTTKIASTVNGNTEKCATFSEEASNLLDSQIGTVELGDNRVLKSGNVSLFGNKSATSSPEVSDTESAPAASEFGVKPIQVDINSASTVSEFSDDSSMGETPKEYDVEFVPVGSDFEDDSSTCSAYEPPKECDIEIVSFAEYFGHQSATCSSEEAQNQSDRVVGNVANTTAPCTLEETQKHSNTRELDNKSATYFSEETPKQSDIQIVSVVGNFEENSAEETQNQSGIKIVSVVGNFEENSAEETQNQSDIKIVSVVGNFEDDATLKGHATQCGDKTKVQCGDPASDSTINVPLLCDEAVKNTQTENERQREVLKNLFTSNTPVCDLENLSNVDDKFAYVISESIGKIPYYMSNSRYTSDNGPLYLFKVRRVQNEYTRKLCAPKEIPCNNGAVRHPPKKSRTITDKVDSTTKNGYTIPMYTCKKTRNKQKKGDDEYILTRPPKQLKIGSETNEFGDIIHTQSLLKLQNIENGSAINEFSDSSVFVTTDEKDSRSVPDNYVEQNLEDKDNLLDIKSDNQSKPGLPETLSLFSGIICDHKNFCEFEGKFAGLNIDQLYPNRPVALPECSVVITRLSDEELKKWTSPSVRKSVRIKNRTRINKFSVVSRRRKGKSKRWSKKKTNNAYHCIVCKYIAAHENRWQFSGQYPGKNETLFSCIFCKFVSADSNNLIRHRMHHSIYQYKCVECFYSGSYKEELVMHYISQHYRDKPFVCSLCNAKFITQCSIINHAWAHAVAKSKYVYLDHNYATCANSE